MSSLKLEQAVARAAAIHVTQMSVALDLTLGPASFDSISIIDFDATAPATVVDIKGRLVDATLNGYPVNTMPMQDRLVLRSLHPHNQLVVHCVMDYSSDGEGLCRHVDQLDGQVYVYAMSFLDAAPRWFACFDQPDLKAPYNIDVKVPDGWGVWGNGPAAQSQDGSWHIVQPCPLATYFVTLVAGPWASVEREHDGIPLTLLARQSLAAELTREADNIFDVTAASFDAYHQMFTGRYPWGAYTQAFVPDFNAGAMENPGCITLRDQYLLRGKPTRRERAQRAGTIAHEMAHQWFGDLVTMRWWDDLWLNESFAEYMGHRVIAERTSYELWTQFGIVRKDWGSIADQSPSTHPVAGNGAADAAGALANFDGISYAKGASLLRHLAASMGDATFLAGLNDYFYTHQFGNAAFADLIAAWQRAGAGDVAAFADEWLLTSGMDKITVSPNGATLTINHGRTGVAQAAGVSFEVAALGGDGSELSRQTVYDALPGHRVMDAWPRDFAAVVPDAGDLCWAKVRPSSWSLPPIGRVQDAATRVVLHNAIRDAVRDGELLIGDALNLLLDGLPGEISDDIVDAMLGFAVDLAGVWSPWGARASRLLEVAGLIEQLATMAQPGSDRQMILARALTRCGSDTGQLNGWLRGDVGSWQGLEPDPELRWGVINRLMALGGDVSLVDAELVRDPLGADKAAGARAASPSRPAKRAALDALLEPSDRRAYELYEIAGSIWQVGQEGLCVGLAAEWMAGIGATSEFRQGWSLARIARASFPLIVASESMMPLARAAIERTTDDRLRRELVDSTAMLERILTTLRA